MTNPARFDPFREMTRFNPFHSAEDFMQEFSMLPSLRGLEAAPRIRIDVSETDQAYIIKTDIPGAKKDDIQVSIDGGTVSIKAAIKEKKEEEMAGNMMRSERYYGEQDRSFTLPREIDDTKVEARYQDGVLALTLPKKAGSTSKPITIQ